MHSVEFCFVLGVFLYFFVLFFFKLVISGFFLFWHRGILGGLFDGNFVHDKKRKQIFPGNRTDTDRIPRLIYINVNLRCCQ